jgi:hypothetical protein
MTPEQIEAVRRRVLADRRAQGLPDHVEDRAVLRRVAELLHPQEAAARPTARSA